MKTTEGLGATDDPVSPLVGALRRILPPLVRLLLRHRLTLPVLTGLLKEIYVDVARQELADQRRRDTDSQVSLMTGVHRKDVRRLRTAPVPQDPVPAAASRGAQIALRWMTAGGYQDPQGRPIPLPRTAEPDTPSFNTLVESLSKDVRPRALLEELLQVGAAYLDDDGAVHLRVEGFVPEAGFEEKAFYFGRSLRDHMAAAAHNLLGERAPMFERSVYYEGLCEDSMQELEELSNLLAMDALRTVNRRGAALKRRDAKRKAGTHRITLGAYFFRGRRDRPVEEPE